MSDTTDTEQPQRFGTHRISEARLAARRERRANRRRALAERHGWVTLAEAVEMLGCNEGNVRRWADRHGVRRDPVHGFYDAAAVKAESDKRRVARAKSGS